MFTRTESNNEISNRNFFCLTVFLLVFALDVKQKIYSQDFLTEEVLCQLSLIDLRNWSQFEINVKGIRFFVENKDSFIQITRKGFWGFLKKTYI